jgi:hypothetical protein
MFPQRALKPLAGMTLIAALFTVAMLTREIWLPWVTTAPESPGHAQDQPKQALAEPQAVRLTPQAQGNLGLVSKPLKVDTFWRTIQVPGIIVDRPAESDRAVIAPASSIVTKVHSFPGEIVRSGDMLFTLWLLSETVHLTQANLYKTAQEIEITGEQKKRLTGLSQMGAVSEARMIELNNQLRRLAASANTYRQELQARGLTRDQIDSVTQGTYVSEIYVTAPKGSGTEKQLLTASRAKNPAPLNDEALRSSFEIQELKVELGQQVQPGQTLSLLANHQALYIEGRAFRQETPLVERAAKEDWPLEVEFMEGAGNDWPVLKQLFQIRHIANTIDPVTRTFPFFLPLSNQCRSFQKDGKTLMLWRFRPGQKVRLHIKVEKFENVFVLPADALVREGPEAYVFRQNGDLFDRKAVRVVYQDRQHVLIANDGSVPPGVFIAQSGATQLNRVLKAQGGQPSGFHVHADGTVHANH